MRRLGVLDGRHPAGCEKSFDPGLAGVAECELVFFGVLGEREVFGGLKTSPEDDITRQTDMGQRARGGKGEEVLTELAVELLEARGRGEKKRSDRRGMRGTEMSEHIVRTASEGGTPVVHVDLDVHAAVGGGLGLGWVWLWL